MNVTESRQRPNEFAQELFDGLPRRYDRLGALLSFGQDRRWRRALVDALVAASPRLVLDVATGPAGVALQISDRTGAEVVGADLTLPMLQRAQVNVRSRGAADRVRLVAARGEELPFRDETFDALSFTYLLRYVADPAATIRELARVVKPGGVVSNLEFAVPSGPVWHPLWVLYTRTLLPAAGYVAGGREWWDVGRFLGPSIAEHYRAYPVDWHVAAWNEAGIADVHVRSMSLGGGIVMWGRKAGGDETAT